MASSYSERVLWGWQAAPEPPELGRKGCAQQSLAVKPGPPTSQTLGRGNYPFGALCKWGWE